MLALAPQTAQAVAELARLEQLPKRAHGAAFHDIGRRLQHDLAQHVGDRFEFLAVGVEARGIAG